MLSTKIGPSSPEDDHAMTRKAIALRRQFAALCFGLALFGAAAAADPSRPFITNADLDLLRFVAPPPADDSAETRADLDTLIGLQNTRTPEMVANASADIAQDVWRFTNALPAALQPRFDKQALPQVDAFFDRLRSTKSAVIDPPKLYWHRPRPYDLSPQIVPGINKEHTLSYPSGHATGGTLMAIVLADMLPEYRDAILRRAVDYARNRSVGGVHYPSDVVAGRIVGTLIAARLQSDEAFLSQFGEVKAALRSQLRLPP